MEKIYITDESIPLGKFLKLTNMFDSGGFIKHYLKENNVSVNDEIENKRGRKLFHGDIVQVDESNIFILHAQN